MLTATITDGHHVVGSEVPCRVRGAAVARAHVTVGGPVLGHGGASSVFLGGGDAWPAGPLVLQGQLTVLCATCPVGEVAACKTGPEWHDSPRKQWRLSRQPCYTYGMTDTELDILRRYFSREFDIDINDALIVAMIAELNREQVDAILGIVKSMPWLAEAR
jgi:hypothetical protein